MGMTSDDVQDKGWQMKRQQAYEALYDGDRWDMVYGLLESLVSKLIDNGSITLDDLRDNDLQQLARWKSIKQRYPKS